MRRIDYKVALDGEPFAVASCDIARPYSEDDNHPLPIKMKITHCGNTDGKAISIVHAASLNDYDVPADFAEHYVDILLGDPSDWVLAQFQVGAGGIDLEYYRPSTDDVENIRLTVDGDPVNLLHLDFEVPHPGNRPTAKYRVELNRERISRKNPFHNAAIIVERLPSAHRRTVFALYSDKPGEMSVTEYVDL